ncbi:MAG: 2-hydroxychromene-2-carboxylate isomerase [Noviherbaspirillum sp.]|nr:2-hydroxychromene-2-carboxylate isomerase [Noviherbaspirillum sp.]
MATTIEFFFDFASPYAYLAHVRLPEIARRNRCSISYRPVDLPEIKRAAGNIGPSSHFLPARKRYIQQDTARWARRYGVPIAQPSNFDSARLNRGVFLAIGRGVATEYVDAVGRRVWAEGGAMNDESLLAGVAADMGWDAKEFMLYTTSEAAAAAHRATLEVARKYGVFGVPIMVAGEQLWWGNDRLPFVESYLAAHAGVPA